MKIDGLSSTARLSTQTLVSDSSEEVTVREVVKSKSIEQQQDEQKNLNSVEEKKDITKEEAEHIVNGINEFLQPKFTSLTFKLHDKLERYYVEVVDQETKKVIREIPEKELLDMYAKMTEYLGLFIDKKL